MTKVRIQIFVAFIVLLLLSSLLIMQPVQPKPFWRKRCLLARLLYLRTIKQLRSLADMIAAMQRSLAIPLLTD